MVSIIIPVYNEQELIQTFLNQTVSINEIAEFIFVDGGSSDKTKSILQAQNQLVFDAPIGRSIQMNKGASVSKYNYLLFLHIDIILPKNFLEILKGLIDNNIQLANFKLAFDSEHWFLRLNAIFSYSNATPFQFGDQGLWVEKDLFTKIGGFNEEMEIIEDQDIVKRLKVHAPLYKANSTVVVSARKYRTHGVFKLQFVYFYIYFLYRLGYNQDRLLNRMKSLL
jgi:rSAM/selenodomain-associated transferase 2